MKVLLLAVFKPQSTDVSQADAFERLGLTVVRFNYREIAKKLGNWKRDLAILDACRTEKPDFVLFSKCNGVKLSVVRGCNRICPTVLWYMDAMNSNFCINLIRKIRHCTMSFFSNPVPYLEAKKKSRSGRLYFLQEGFDPYMNVPIECQKKYDVSFIGNMRKDRLQYLKEVPFHVINAHGFKHSRAVSETKINLNFTHKNHGTSDRTYKVLASKGFLLTTPWLNMEDDFKIGKDLDIFESPQELREKIAFYLINEEKRNEIAETGFRTVQKFSRDHWAEKIVSKVIQYRKSL